MQPSAVGAAGAEAAQDPDAAAAVAAAAAVILVDADQSGTERNHSFAAAVHV